MKKKISILLCVVLSAALLAACGSGGASDNSSPVRTEMIDRMLMEADYNMPVPAPAEAPAADSEMSFFSTGGGTSIHYGEDSWDDVWYDSAEQSGIEPISATAAASFTEKIIYSVYADIETITFNETIDKVHALMQAYNAFIEHSNISGVTLSSKMYGWTEYRYAHFTLRVPKDGLDGITANLENLGNVTHRNSNAMNITSQFYDTQSRLNSQRVQEERLLDMLSKAEDVPDLIMIEERLSEVRYQIESLTSTLTNWQSQVDYSTLTLSIREVEEYTEPVLIHRTYWEQIGDGFMATMRNVGRFFMNFFKWLIVSAPVLVILAVIGVVIFIVTKRQIKKMAVRRKNSPPKTPAYPGYVYQPPLQYQQQAQQAPQPQPAEAQSEQTADRSEQKDTTNEDE